MWLGATRHERCAEADNRCIMPGAAPLPCGRSRGGRCPRRQQGARVQVWNGVEDALQG